MTDKPFSNTHTHWIFMFFIIMNTFQRHHDLYTVQTVYVISFSESVRTHQN